MDDLISRWSAIDALTDTNLKRNVDSLCDGDMNQARRAAQRVIAQLPAVDAVPVVHGKWQWLSSTIDRIPCEMRYRCSECHHETITHTFDPWENFCPNCGAKMDGDA